MNIFYTSSDPKECAEALVDKHITKMVVETAQLLSTAHRVLDPDTCPDGLYKETHKNHPCAVWVRKSNNNYNWLYLHFLHLCKEYTYRYGKVHATQRLADTLSRLPTNIPIDYFTEPPKCMPDLSIVSANTIECYRYYYKQYKKHLFKWTKRQPPDWILG